MNLYNRDQDDQDREKERDMEREYNFKQSHGGRQRFPGGEWGNSSEFGRNSEHNFSLKKYRNGKRLGADPDFTEPMDSDFEGEEFERSRFAEPYTGGQFSRSQWGRGSSFNRDLGFHNSPGYGENFGFSGRGPKGYTRSDERIREEVCEVLYHDPMVDARGIVVSVSDGVVTLQGSVSSREAKRLAESSIDHLPGVYDVLNQLTISGGDDEQQPRQ